MRRILPFVAAWFIAGAALAQAPIYTRPQSSGGGGGSGTVNSGTASQCAYYAAGGTTVSGINCDKIVRQTFSNADTSSSAGATVIEQTGSMSASRAFTLAAANSYEAGQRVQIIDVSGSVTSTNSIVVTRAGSDTINGATSASIITAYGALVLESDGTSKWTIIGSDASTINGRAVASGTVQTSGNTTAFITGSSTLNPGALAAGACSSIVTTTATGAASGWKIAYDLGDLHATTGYSGVGTTLTIYKYAGTNNVNWYVCNWTSASITASSITAAWTAQP